MTSSSSIAPPSAGNWYDPAQTRSNVLARLRMTESDVDVDRVDRSIAAAKDAIDARLDRTTPIAGPPPAAGLQEALEVAAVAIYHRGTVTATVGAGAITLPTTGEPFDPLADVAVELEPYRERWPVA